jgi:tight adherence protein B
VLLTLLFFGIFCCVAIALYLIAGGTVSDTQKVLARLQAMGADRTATTDAGVLAITKDEGLSEIPWLDQLLHKINVARALKRSLSQADLNWKPAKLILSSILLAIFAGYLVYLRTRSLLLSIMIGAAGGTLPFFYVLMRRNSRLEQIKERLPESLDLMVSAIRAGHTLISALGMAAREARGPLQRELRLCFEEMNFGLELRVAMTNLVTRAPIREIRMIATSVLIQKETGGNLTEILEKVGFLIREDLRLQRQVKVHTAQGRLTGWILSLLPVFLGLALYMVNPEHMSTLWKKPIGLKLLQGALVMTVSGILIIRRIVRVEI